MDNVKIAGELLKIAKGLVGLVEPDFGRGPLSLARMGNGLIAIIADMNKAEKSVYNALKTPDLPDNFREELVKATRLITEAKAPVYKLLDLQDRERFRKLHGKVG